MTFDRASETDPRAFATATGFVFQIVGLILTFGGCCVWSSMGYLQQPADEPVGQLGDYVSQDRVRKTIGLIDMAVTFVAGLGILGTGIGLQGERPNSGHWAVGVTCVWALTWWLSLGGYWWFAAPLWTILLSLLFALVATLLLLMACGSMSVLRAHPPPEDLSVVTDEFLDQYSRKRQE